MALLIIWTIFVIATSFSIYLLCDTTSTRTLGSTITELERKKFSKKRKREKAPLPEGRGKVKHNLRWNRANFAYHFYYTFLCYWKYVETIKKEKIVWCCNFSTIYTEKNVLNCSRDGKRSNFMKWMCAQRGI